MGLEDKKEPLLIYFAGKIKQEFDEFWNRQISPDDFRRRMLDGENGGDTNWEHHCMREQMHGETYTVKHRGTLRYGGPTQVGGKAHDIYNGCADKCLEQIRKCDAVFAYVEEENAYATLFELGYARALGKPICFRLPIETETPLHSLQGRIEWHGNAYYGINGFIGNQSDMEAKDAKTSLAIRDNWWFAIWHTDQFDYPKYNGHISDIIPDALLRPAPYANRKQWYSEIYLQSEHWKNIRAGALERAKERCQLCNKDERLQVHHRTYENLGHEQDCDLTVLCRACHAKFHDK